MKTPTWRLHVPSDGDAVHVEKLSPRNLPSAFCFQMVGWRGMGLLAKGIYGLGFRVLGFRVYGLGGLSCRSLCRRGCRVYWASSFRGGMKATSILHARFPRGRKSTSIPEHPFYIDFPLEGGCKMDVGRGVGKWRNIHFASILPGKMDVKFMLGGASP